MTSPIPSTSLAQSAVISPSEDFTSFLPAEIFYHIFAELSQLRDHTSTALVSRLWNKNSSDYLQKEQQSISALTDKFELTRYAKTWKEHYLLQENLFLILKNVSVDKIPNFLKELKRPALRDQAIQSLLSRRNVSFIHYAEILECTTASHLKEKLLFHFLINANQTISSEKRHLWSYMFMDPNENSRLLNLCSIGFIDGEKAVNLLKEKGQWLVRFSVNHHNYYLSMRREEKVVHYTLNPQLRIQDAAKITGVPLDIKQHVFEASKDEVLTFLITHLSKSHFVQLQTSFYSLYNSVLDQKHIDLIKSIAFKHTEVKQFSIATLDRNQVEQRLQTAPLGSWLVRFSLNINTYVLSRRTEKGFVHTPLTDASITIQQFITKFKFNLAESLQLR